jgi:hypothetical protein
MAFGIISYLMCHLIMKYLNKLAYIKMAKEKKIKIERGEKTE